jgi:hypothetical protein
VAIPQAGSEPGHASATSPVAALADPPDAEIAALRAETTGQLQIVAPATSAPAPAPNALRATSPPSASTPPAAPPESATDKQLAEAFQERLLLLDEYDKASRRLKKAVHPEPSPEEQAAEARAELIRLQARQARAATNPEILLPQTFGVPGPGGKSSVSAEMKEAIEAATGDVKEYQVRLESMRAEVASWEARQNARRAERDKLFQTVAAMQVQVPQRDEAGEPASASSATRRLARERSINARW